MADQAKITSLDALEFLRSSIIVFLGKARQSLDEARDAVRRTRQWLDHDQQLHWESQIKVRRRLLDQATQELFAARLSKNIDKTPRQQAHRKAKAAMDLAEEKLRATKKWSQNFDAAADPYSKKLESLRQFLDDEMPKAITYLVQAQRTLQQYAETGASPVTAPAPQSTPETPARPEVQS